MMKNKEKLRERVLRDRVPHRLAGLGAAFGSVSSVARISSDSENVERLLEEAKYLIEWTAAEAEPEVAAELVSIQSLINLWLRAWGSASQNKEQRILLSVQAKQWSDRALDFSGLLNQTN